MAVVEGPVDDGGVAFGKEADAAVVVVAVMTVLDGAVEVRVTIVLVVNNGTVVVTAAAALVVNSAGRVVVWVVPVEFLQGGSSEVCASGTSSRAVSVQIVNGSGGIGKHVRRLES